MNRGALILAAFCLPVIGTGLAESGLAESGPAGPGPAGPGGDPSGKAATEGVPDPLAIFQRECVSCHSESKQKGGLLIDSRESLLRGGDTDAAIIPGDAAGSYLVETLYPDAESHMPPKGQLDPREIAAIETWINEGAEWDAERWSALQLPGKQDVELTGLPSTYAPVFALALSPNGRNLAVGRGSRIDWYAVEQPDDTAAA